MFIDRNHRNIVLHKFNKHVNMYVRNIPTCTFFFFIKYAQNKNPTRQNVVEQCCPLYPTTSESLSGIYYMALHKTRCPSPVQTRTRTSPKSLLLYIMVIV